MSNFRPSLFPRILSADYRNAAVYTAAIITVISYDLGICTLYNQTMLLVITLSDYTVYRYRGRRLGLYVRIIII